MGRDQGLVVASFVARTTLENKTLRAELDAYEAYAARGALSGGAGGMVIGGSGARDLELGVRGWMWLFANGDWALE